MSDFIQDMKDATEQYNKWANNSAILDADFRDIDTLIQKHYDNRETLFEIMLKILEQTDDSLADNWERVCDQAIELLDRLNDAIPSRARRRPQGYRIKQLRRGRAENLAGK